MLRLRTFGGLTLASGDAPLTGAATQRRRLAILALLAVARDRGVSRDKLVAYLWPESGAERARHVLNQLVYAQRKHFGTLSLFTGRKSLRLNTEVIWTDVGAFEAALDREDAEAAVALYAGPFLDGFFLRDAREFERWVESQRQRLARRCGGALVALARGAAARRDRREATQWWGRALEHDPLDSDIAAGAVDALTALGDRPGALRAARVHEAALRDHLGLDLSPDLQRAVQRLQSGD